MLNQVVLVGRLVEDPKLVELEGGQKTCDIKLAVQRSYKNANGEYDVDFITCKLWEGVASNTVEYCKKGDIVGVKGRLQTEKLEKEDGAAEYKTNVISEKITFLSSRKEGEN